MQDDLQIRLCRMHGRDVGRDNLILPVVQLQTRRQAIRPQAELEAVCQCIYSQDLRRACMGLVQGIPLQTADAVPNDISTPDPTSTVNPHAAVHVTGDHCQTRRPVERSARPAWPAIRRRSSQSIGVVIPWSMVLLGYDHG